MNKTELFREPFYFKSKDDNLFSWIHHVGQSSFDSVAVICSPLGKEYSNTHRTVRHLADKLAKQGIPALRFDYFSVGDSSGDEFDSDLVEHWLEDIKSSITQIKKQTGCKKVILIGIRLGATLMALVSREIDVDLQVFWYPVYYGRAFIRELEITARTSVKGMDESLPYLEATGFIVTKETQQEIKKLSLIDAGIRASGGILILDDHEVSDAKKLKVKLETEGLMVDYKLTQGMAEMFTLPHFTKVPFSTIETISSWIENKLNKSAPRNFSLNIESSQNLSILKENDTLEKSLIFDQERNLFGIYVKAKNTNTKPVILILNTGADHHVGTNRLSVMLTRKLAGIGFDSFRIDLSGLGDSVTDDPKNENVMYSKLFSEDINSAVNFIQKNFENRPVILLGVCAGGQASYLTGIDRPELPIVDFIVINSIMYRWGDDSFLNFLSNLENGNYVMSSIQNVNKWKNIVLGKVKIQTIVKTLKITVTSFLNNFKSQFPGIKKDFRQFEKNNKRLSLFFAEGEVGYPIFLKNGKKLVKKLSAKNLYRLYHIEDADHVFSTYDSRIRLSEMLKKHLTEYFGESK